MTKELRFVSLNCWGIDHDKARFSAIAGALLLQGADIIALQEVVFQWQVKLLRQRLGHEYEICVPPTRFALLNRGGLLLAVRKDHSVQERAFAPFVRQSPWFHPLGWSDAFLGKGWQVVRLLCGGTELAVFNTHTLGAYQLFPRHERQVIDSQFEELEMAVATHLTPFVLCGDLNRSPASLEDSFLSGVTEAFGLQSDHITVDNMHNPLRQGRVARLSGRGGPRPNKRIDYIFAEGYEFITSTVIFDTPHHANGYEGHLSDHFGVMATVRRQSR